jgi:hypothetical protein
MIHPRAIVLASLLVVTVVTGAAAQVFGVNPQQQQRMPTVCESFMPMRQEAEKSMAGIQAATERKAPREEFCELFKRLAGSTGKMAKFLETNQAACGVPAEAIQRAKSEYSKISTFRKQACSAGPAPSGPKLSDVLGAPLVPDSSTSKPNDSIFNTMTGSPLSTR